jgi:CheY-like chemotaxis protein
MDKILIVDDEKTVLDVLSQSLEDLPFEIVSTEDPVVGLQLFSEHDPFLIILDMNMTSMNGLDFIRYLIQNEVPKHKLRVTHQVQEENYALNLRDADFFVLVLTGYGNRELMHQCSNLGVEYFLNKPVHLNTLRNVVETIHRLKTNREELIKMSAYHPLDHS